MTYQQAIKTIEQAGKRKALRPVFLRIQRLMLLFQFLNIEIETPAIHIAGTSGKGSTSALCSEVLRAAGYHVGLHTSPHLQTPRERMMVDGKMPSETTFADLIERVWQGALEVEQNHSYGAFNSNDILFAATMLHFHEMRVDIAVIETSLGGEFDSTNVILPLVSVITNVDLDHTKVLGESVEAIALVKAGVIKPQTPFITGAAQSSVNTIFKKRAADVGAPCIVIGEESSYKARSLGQQGSILSAQVLDNLFANLHIRLLGKHQIRNALLVLYIVQVLRSRGWLIADDAVKIAFENAFIPGRLEVIQENPLIILDGAHNPAKARALADSLKRIFRNKKIIFVFGLKKGKDITNSIKPLLNVADKFIVTSLPNEKGLKPSIIAKTIKQLGGAAVVRKDPWTALALARSQVKKDGIICVTGSLYLVGQLRSTWYPAESINYPVLANEPQVATRA